MPHSGSNLTLTEHQLSYTLPYDYSGVLRFLSIRALPGVESVTGGVYRRTFQINGDHGVLETGLNASAQHVTVRIWYSDTSQIPEILSRVARILGIDHDSSAAVEHLAADPLLEPLVRQRPGLRIPGAWDPFEIAVRAVTGQQVTLSTATSMVARAARICGTPLNIPEWEALGLTRLFPEPEQLAEADLFDMGMPQARMAALRSLAQLAASDSQLFQPADGGRLKRLQAQPGVGDWTAQYISMRALRDTDAFPAADVVIRRMLTPPGQTRPTPAAVLRRAEVWRPWRSFATVHLWTAASLEQEQTPRNPAAIAATAAGD